MSLQNLYTGLAGVLSPDLEIERIAAAALATADTSSVEITDPAPLHPEVDRELVKPGLPAVCESIANTPLPWAPPATSDDPAYVALNRHKVHVELLGPDGLITSNTIRIGVYGLLPNAEYGIRTHPAEEVFVMLAGEAYWKRDDDDYQLQRSGERSFHPSMLPHATKTGDRAFMSVYVWRGDIATANYTYFGLPA